ncbi:MAG: methyl-accepting chemotaxis protein [Elusimicrobiota bacterium]
MADKPRNKRKTVVIKKALQFKCIIFIIVAMLIVALSIGWDIYYTMMRVIAELDIQELYPVMTKISNLMFGKLVILLAIFFIVTIFISHKFAGPIFRLEKSLDIIAGGNLTYRMCLRNGDELIELQDKFNNMVSEIQKKISVDKNLAKIANEKLLTISSRLSRQEALSYELPRVLEEISDLIAELNKISSDFKV